MCVFRAAERGKPNYSYDQSNYQKKKKKSLTQKCLGWKTSRFSLLQPIKRVIKHPHSTHTHTHACHIYRTNAKRELVHWKQCLRTPCSPICLHHKRKICIDLSETHITKHLHLVMHEILHMPAHAAHTYACITFHKSYIPGLDSSGTNNLYQTKRNAV